MIANPRSSSFEVIFTERPVKKLYWSKATPFFDYSFPPSYASLSNHTNYREYTNVHRVLLSCLGWDM